MNMFCFLSKMLNIREYLTDNSYISKKKFTVCIPFHLYYPRYYWPLHNLVAEIGTFLKFWWCNKNVVSS